MIIRILSEGQYRLSGADLDRLNEIDNRVVRAIETDDERTFREQLSSMLAFVRERGQQVPLEELIESDIILPAEDITLDEAREAFSGEGAIPG